MHRSLLGPTESAVRHPLQGLHADLDEQAHEHLTVAGQSLQQQPPFCPVPRDVRLVLCLVCCAGELGDTDRLWAESLGAWAWTDQTG